MPRRIVVAGGLLAALLVNPLSVFAQVTFDGLLNQPLGGALLNTDGNTLTVQFWNKNGTMDYEDILTK